MLTVVQVIDDVMSLRERFCGGDDVVKHRRDFDWLLEAVNKVNQSYSTSFLKHFPFIV